MDDHPEQTLLPRSSYLHAAGTASADHLAELFAHHLMTDAVVEPARADLRQSFEAAASSVRDLLSRRWVETDHRYDSANPKRVYYLSMEYLIGRSLANNVTTMMLKPAFDQALRDRTLDWMSLVEQEPDAGLGNGGLGRLAACFLDSMATMQLPAMGYGLRYEYGMFKQSIESGWQREQADNWLRTPDPWEIQRPRDVVEVKLGCSIVMHQGHLEVIPNRPSSLIGMPYDRPVVGFGGKTVNTLRLWRAAAHDDFDFHEFSSGDFVASLVGRISSRTITRVLYPDDSTNMGQGLRFIQEYFLVACSLADLIRRFRQANSDWALLPEKCAIQMNDTHPTLAVPELMRILLDDAGLDWEQAWDLTKRTLPIPITPCFPRRWRSGRSAISRRCCRASLEIIYEINRRLLDDVRQRFPGDEGKGARHQPDRGRCGGQSPHGASRDCRFPQHQWCRRHPFRSAAKVDCPRSRGDVSPNGSTTRRTA